MRPDTCHGKTADHGLPQLQKTDMVLRHLSDRQLNGVYPPNLCSLIEQQLVSSGFGKNLFPDKATHQERWDSTMASGDGKRRRDKGDEEKKANEEQSEMNDHSAPLWASTCFCH